MYLRFLRASPGDTKFNVKSAFKVMKNYSVFIHPNSMCLPSRIGVSKSICTLSASKTFTLNSKKTSSFFQAPSNFTNLHFSSIRTKAGYSYLYMKPGLYFPSTDSLPDLLRSLVYLLECMTEEEKSATEGVAFMADMANWGTKFHRIFTNYVRLEQLLCWLCQEFL